MSLLNESSLCQMLFFLCQFTPDIEPFLHMHLKCTHSFVLSANQVLLGSLTSELINMSIVHQMASPWQLYLSDDTNEEN